MKNFSVLRLSINTLMLVLLAYSIGVVHVNQGKAQEAATATPAIIVLPTADTSIGSDEQGSGGTGEIILATPTWTPSGPPPVLLEALDIANVRNMPDTAASQLGVIRSGEFYNVLGQYGNWVQLQYEASPSGYGWVYGELVRITGDTSVIAQVDPYATPEGADAGLGDAGGVVATATISTENLATATSIVLPTFTYPPGVLRPNGVGTSEAPTEEPAPALIVDISSSESLPPVAPILIMGGLGLIGLILSSFRRS